MNIIEIEGHRVITDGLNKDSIIFDCGACVGEFTYQLRKICNGWFYLYEPDPRNFRRLKNRFKDDMKIFPFEVGIGNKIGNKEFHLGKFITSSSFFKSHRGLGDMMVNVPITTLEEEMRVFDKPIDLLKLDLEGSEIDVIPSINESVLSKIKQITVEFHPQSKIDDYTQEKIDICREHLKKQFNEIEYVDKGNDGHHGLYLNKDI